MSPVVAQVEHIDELLTGFEAGHVEAPLVQNGVVEIRLRADSSDSGSVTEFELVQMCAVPSRKPIVNRAGQVTERVVQGSRDDPAWPWPQVLTSPFNQLTRTEIQAPRGDACAGAGLLGRAPRRARTSPTLAGIGRSCTAKAMPGFD